jgi:site-specific recombinase XerD
VGDPWVNHASLRHVQDLLGYRSLATTERYLRLTITDLKEAHAKFHQRENNT